MSAYLVLLLVIATSLWTYKLLFENFVLGLLVIFTTVVLYRSFPKVSKLSLVLLILLVIAQYKTTSISSLTKLDNSQETILQMRLREYPPVYLQIGEKTLWIPAAHWLEERKESIALARIEKNFSETVDFNLYFFGNHPRERTGYKEFEKLPYFYLPIFLYGLYMLIQERKPIVWSFTVLPIILYALIGTQVLLGPFSLYPFIVAVTASGTNSFYQKYKAHKELIFAAAILLILIFIQTLAYG